MCLILFSYQVSKQTPFVVAANRDEFFHRATQPAGFWPESPDLLAGKDLVAGGTWMGITQTGRFAALTNVRRPSGDQYQSSRGALVSGFLQDSTSPETYLQALPAQADHYAGFNLLVGDPDSLWFYSNRFEGGPRPLKPGIYGLSNGDLDSDWPKVRRGKSALEQATADKPDVETMFALLADRQQAEDEELPDTGVGLALERMLSPRFIQSPSYGTRASTVVTVDNRHSVDFIERSFDNQGALSGEQVFQFTLSP